MKNNKKTIKIIIPNATSPRNLGDRAILDGTINLFRKILPTSKIIVHSSDPNLYETSEKSYFKIKHTFYSWAVLSQTKNLLKIIRMIQLLIVLIGLKINIPINSLFIDRELKILINNMNDSDIVFFAGGGYIRSKNGVKQILNLLMQFYPFLIASILSKKTIVGPISFGPFAHKWHEILSAAILRKTDLIAAREEISFKIMKLNNVTNTIITSDFAFFLKRRLTKKKAMKKLIIGLTIRNWFRNDLQFDFEKQIIIAILRLAKKRKFIIQPIIQVNAPMYGDLDKLTTQRIIKQLQEKKIKVNSLLSPRTLKEALEHYSSIDMLLGMRMHSNILASILGVPFIGLNYEHKTLGIAQQLDMSKYCLNVERIRSTKISNLIIDSIRQKDYLKKKLLSRTKEIQSIERLKWSKILTAMTS